MFFTSFPNLAKAAADPGVLINPCFGKSGGMQFNSRTSPCLNQDLPHQ
jgi:hypothetical protein